MAWVAAAVGGGIALVGGAMATRGQGKAAKQQAAMQREQMQFARDQYADYKDLYGDLEAGMIEEIESYQPGEKLQKYLDESAADVSMTFDKRQEQASRRLGRFGIDPSQTRFAEETAEVGREKALAEVGGRTEARRRSEAEDDKNFARRLAAISTGKEIPGQAGAVMGALQAGGEMYGRRAEQYGKGAESAYGTAGRFLAKGVSDYSGGGYGMDAGGTTAPVAGVDYGVPTSNVYGGAGFGEAEIDPYD